MKVKIYPLKKLVDDTITIPCSTFLFSVELICASLARGVSIIRNIPATINESLLSWCRQIGAIIKIYPEKVIVRGIDNKLDFQNSMFISEDMKTIKQFLPILSSCSQPIGIKTSKENIIKLRRHKDILEKFNCLYFEEDNKIRIERELSPLNLSFVGNEDLSLVLSYILAAPLLSGQSKIKLNIPVFYLSDYKTIIKVLRKFKIDIKITNDMTIEIPGNQEYKACKINTEMDSYIASIFGVLANHYHKKIRTRGYTHHYFNDGMFFDYLKDKEFIAKKHKFTYTHNKKNNYSLNKIEASFIRGGIPFGTLLFVLNNKEGKISKVNLKDMYHKRFIDLFEKGFAKTNIQFEKVDDDIIIKPSIIDKKVQIDSDNNTYIALTLALIALASKEPITIKNVDSAIRNYPTFFDNLNKLGAKIEYIHD